MSNMADVILEAGTAYPSRAPEFTPGFFMGSVLLICLVFVLSYYVFLRSKLRVVISAWKRCSVRLYLQLFVRECMSYLNYSCAHSGVKHIVLCFCFVCILCCQFLWIVPFGLFMTRTSSSIYEYYMYIEMWEW